MLNGLKNWLLGLMASALNGFDNMLASASDVLKGGLGAWYDVADLSSNLRPFCYTIIAICLLIEVVQVFMRSDVMKWETGLKLCIKLVFAKVCIDVAPTFLQACYAQAQAWISGLSSGGSTLGNETLTHLIPLVQSVEGFGNILGMFLSVFVVILAVKVCGLMIQVIAYGRMFELYVYLVVSPLPCAFFPLGDSGGGFSNSITSKFFKSFAAVCLQGVMMVIVIRVFDIVMSTAISEALTAAAGNSDANAAITDLIYTMLLGAIALVMAIFKSGNWAKSILNAM